MRRILRHDQGRRTLPLLAMLLACGIFTGAASDPSGKTPVIVIITDTVSAKHCSLYGFERKTTPTLDRMAAESVVYDNVISAAPWTLPGCASILTGLFPSRHAAGYKSDPWSELGNQVPLSPRAPTLAELFKQHGYRTAAFVNNLWLKERYGLNRGFDHYDYKLATAIDFRRGPETNLAAIQWLYANDRHPFFMLVHYFDPHLAYEPPLEVMKNYISDTTPITKMTFNPDKAVVAAGVLEASDEERKFIGSLYEGDIQKTDRDLANLFDFLRYRGVYDRALIVVVADHGEEIWEHGRFGHGFSIHREVAQIPLLIKYPHGQFGGHRVRGRVSNVDVVPTLADFMGWELQAEVDGVSLVPRDGVFEPDQRLLVIENVLYGEQRQGYYLGKYKTILNRQTGGVEIYDLEQDPDEMHNLYGQVEIPKSDKALIMKTAGELRRALLENIPTTTSFDWEDIEKLRDLGYIQGPDPKGKP